MKIIFFFLSKIVDFTFRTIGFLSRDKFPQIVSVVAIVRNQQGEFLIQDRADGRGYCLPGGLTNFGEKLEIGVIREVFEETGIKIKNTQFLFYQNVTKKDPYSLLIVFKGDVESGSLQNSWEGNAHWMRYEDFKGKMAFGEDGVMEMYLKL